MEEKSEITKDVTEVVHFLRSFLVLFTSSFFSASNHLILLSSQRSLLKTPLWYISTKSWKVVLPKLLSNWRQWSHAKGCIQSDQRCRREGLNTPGKVGEVCVRINIRRKKEHIEEILYDSKHSDRSWKVSQGEDSRNKG
ncbi:uncharacterized protein LOC132645239 isoform X3 [Lycium barbarum]|uniref:uncharacterized protein LOC132645239 isoform X3 n=1 Tax=Lycium barbarum TaxID=112863 RepID=UPI00293E073C|nr:uncharacterized protein LOC132645239 isoform X3 [Lycium barbarum]